MTRAARRRAPWLAFLVLVPAAGLRAEEALTDTRAFEHAAATSFYGFDACGDGLDGRLYRRALMDKFRHCPFSDAARARFADRVQAQQRVSRAKLDQVIDENGGLPVQLPGMDRTCHEQLASPDHQRLHEALQKYASGDLGAEAVLASPCDAATIEP